VLGVFIWLMRCSLVFGERLFILGIEMAGTMIVAKGKSLDVRAVDFELIADALRSRVGRSDVAMKLLQSVDEFGMDMICADELNSIEFKEFYDFLDDIREELADSPGVVDFINQVRLAVQSDIRFDG
jgi:hypothetical protein